MRIYGGVADQRVDLAPGCERRIHEALQFGLAPDVAGHCDGGPARCANRVDDLLAGGEVAAADGHAGAVLCHPERDGPADAAAGSSDDGDLAGQIEQIVHAALLRGFAQPCQ